MKEIVDYSKNIEQKITSLKTTIGKDTAREDLRRFAHHLRNYEYSGNYKNIKSKLLLQAEIIKSIYNICENSPLNDNIKNLLHHTLEFNLKVHNKSIAKNNALELVMEEISKLNNNNNPFSIIIIKAKENHFSLIIEKSSNEISAKNLKHLSALIVDFCHNVLSKQDIYKKLHSSLKYINNCPVKIHCLDKNQSSSRVSGIIDLNKSSNIRIFNYTSANAAIGYSKLYETSKKISNFFSLNIVYAISYILAKKNLVIDNNKITKSINKSYTNKQFRQNSQNIIEHTIARLAEEDKYVIGSIDRKFNLNNRVKNFPDEIKQININELDNNGLKNLKNLVNNRIKKVDKLQKYATKLTSDNFDHHIIKNHQLIPQLVLDQAKLIRAKKFLTRGEAIMKSKLFLNAVNYFSAAIKLDPKFKQAYFQRATCRFNLKEYNEACLDFGKAIEIDECYAEAYFQRGLAYAELKQLKKSIFDFQKAIEFEGESYL